MTPEERAMACRPRQAYTDEIDLECVTAIAKAIREAEIEVALHFQAEVNNLVAAVQLAEQRMRL